MRGYNEGLLAGDQGCLVSAELRFPLRNVMPEPSVWPLAARAGQNDTVNFLFFVQATF